MEAVRPLRRAAGRIARTVIRSSDPARPGLSPATTPMSRSFGLDRGTPIDRYYIEGFLRAHAARIRGRVLEVGDSAYSRRFGSGVEASEVLHAGPGAPPGARIGDLTQPETLPLDHADCFICTQTLNFIFAAGDAVRGAHRLLRPGGTLLLTAAGISQISRYDMDRWGDFWRFTTASLERLLRPAFGDALTLTSYGNVLAATALLQGLAVEDLPEPRLLDEHDPDYQVVIAAAARKSP